MQKLPIGIQTFQKIRSDDYVYIDKTPEALRLLDSGYQYFFLSRPRRFGKSLFIDTLHNIFEGNKKLFLGLHIYDKYDWNLKYPVIRVDFGNQKANSAEKLALYIKNRLLDIAQQYEVEIKRDEYYEIFKELITKLKDKYNQKVVILIDEYDKPILDNIEDTPLALEMREILRGFYTIIKGADADLRFAFLTGVSKFAKASIFSGLNNLQDISLDTRYSTICGYTQTNLEESFEEHLDGVDLEAVKRWYNGYSWLGDSLYNPFDILLFLDNPEKEFKNYWFETGTPTFLVKLIKDKQYFLPNLSNLEAGESLINSFDIEDLDLEAILFQAGYLSIKEKTTDMFNMPLYKLDFPNFETKHSFNNLFIEKIAHSERHKSQSGIYKSLLSNNLESLKTNLISLYASISYHNFTKNQLDKYEGFYASVLYAYFASLGVEIIPEDITNKGRIDMTIKMGSAIYIFEFKVDKGSALSQIKGRNYQEKYLNSDIPIYLIGIEFNSKKRNIEKMEWEGV